VIVLDQRDQALTCSSCGEQEGITPREMANEAVLAVRTSRMADQHAGCEKWAHNPARAKAERGYTVRMRALLAQA
jgi:hypothetical protein